MDPNKCLRQDFDTPVLLQNSLSCHCPRKFRDLVSSSNRESPSLPLLLDSTFVCSKSGSGCLVSMHKNPKMEMPRRPPRSSNVEALHKQTPKPPFDLGTVGVSLKVVLFRN